jgi:hypothetical protein
MKPSFSQAELSQLAVDCAHELLSSEAARTPAHRYEAHFNIPILHLALIRYAEAGDTEVFLGSDITLHGVAAREVLRDFLKRFLINIREIVCGKEGREAAKAANLSAKGMATAIAVWLTSAVGLSGATAIALSTMTILVIGNAAKKSLCEMTDGEVFDALNVKARTSAPRRKRGSKEA